MQFMKIEKLNIKIKKFNNNNKINKNFKDNYI